MKINGYQFTEEDKKTFKDYLDLCDRIWQVNSEHKPCLEYGSSDYKYPIGFKPIKIEEPESFGSPIGQDDNWVGIIEKPKIFQPR